MNFPLDLSSLSVLAAASALLFGCAAKQSDDRDDNAIGTADDSQPDTGSDSESDSQGEDGQACEPGQISCDGTSALLCNEFGDIVVEDCAENDQVCISGTGCVDCFPGSEASCGDDGWAVYCDASGHWRKFFCDEGLGMVCEPDGCKGACSPMELGENYYGCEYWPTITPNVLGDSGYYDTECFSFAVAVANVSEEPANITVTRQAQKLAEVKVEPGSQQVIELPWIEELQGEGYQQDNHDVLVKGGAYRLRSDRPVVVYQFSPLQYAVPVSSGCPSNEYPPNEYCNSYTNDASLLLPTTSLTGNYMSAAWADSMNPGDFLAITAVYDATTIHVRSMAESVQSAGTPALGVLQETEVKLDAGDVVVWFAAKGGLSGSRIYTDGKPVQVISGHPCANVPSTIEACDHLEETVLPMEALGGEYLVTAPTTPAGVRRHSVRLHAIDDQTNFTFSPPETHAPLILGKGMSETLLCVEGDFRVKGTKPFAVTQYMHGMGSSHQSSTSPSPPSVGVGDPSQSVVVPIRQFRDQYYFYEPTTYDDNFVNIVAEEGVEVVLDGAAISQNEFEPIGGTGYGIARHALDHKGAHEIHSAEPFGILVYGYGNYTSYMYPGGLNLISISVPPAVQ